MPNKRVEYELEKLRHIADDSRYRATIQLGAVSNPDTRSFLTCLIEDYTEDVELYDKLLARVRK
jgi:hypothetical protein